MRAFAAVVATTLRQLLGGRRTIGLALVALLPAVVLLATAGRRSPAGGPPLFHEAPLVILMLIVLPVTSLVFGAGALGDERREATLSFLLLRPMPRAALAGAKLLAAWGAAFAVVGSGAAALALTLGVRTGIWETLGPLLAGGRALHAGLHGGLPHPRLPHPPGGAAWDWSTPSSGRAA